MPAAAPAPAATPRPGQGRRVMRHWPAVRVHARQAARRSSPEQIAPASAGWRIARTGKARQPGLPGILRRLRARSDHTSQSSSATCLSAVEYGFIDLVRSVLFRRAPASCGPLSWSGCWAQPAAARRAPRRRCFDAAASGRPGWGCSTAGQRMQAGLCELACGVVVALDGGRVIERGDAGHCPVPPRGPSYAAGARAASPAPGR